MSQVHNLVSVDWLHEHLHAPNVAVIDCRFTLGKKGQGLDEYLVSHIPHALFFDLEHDLSAPLGKHGGRHPLPEVAALTELFSTAGIDQDVTVVAYDDQNMGGSARLWWLLRYLGHDKVVVLDGGFQAWQTKDYPVTDEVAKRDARTFVANVQPHMLTSVDAVKEQGAEAMLIDSRAAERYLGDVEPLDPQAGHIPGACHFFFKDVLRADGTMKTADELQKHFAPLVGKDEVIVYCGSGVTACVNMLALHQIGRTDAKLYAGSWSDWCSYEGLPVATGDEQ